MTATAVLVDQLVFPEGPRWHEGKLWFSDMHDSWVMTVDAAAVLERVVEVPNYPSGLGWLPDGRLLVVSMRDRRLLRLDADGLHETADLSALESGACNDMVVDARGRAYVGAVGLGFTPGETLRPGAILLVPPDGRPRVAASDVTFPNGSVLTPDGATLIVAETAASRLTAFDVLPDGGLAQRRVWAAVEGMSPDGICLDAEGAIWVASPLSGDVLRVLEGGRVSHRLQASQRAYACMLGGTERRTLFVLTAPSHSPRKTRALRSGRIETVEVEVPGAGLP
jgi:sugar lactone lactonase YvrE